MKRNVRLWLVELILIAGVTAVSFADIRNRPDSAMKNAEPTGEEMDMEYDPMEADEELRRAQEAMEAMKEETPPPAKTTKKSSRKILRTEAFIAPPDWEFDGFVAGGQDEKVKSMFAIHDLLYLNIGSMQGLVSGERISIYKRGDRIRDPQSGKFIGFEVRRAAIAEVTDKVDDTTSAVRITKVYEPVEIGDLVRKE